MSISVVPQAKENPLEGNSSTTQGRLRPPFFCLESAAGRMKIFVSAVGVIASGGAA
jgi:hypothetical protein